jgi:hypothetical protein
MTYNISPEHANSLLQTAMFWDEIAAEFGMLNREEIILNDVNKGVPESDMLKLEKNNEFIFPGFQFDKDGNFRDFIKALKLIGLQHDRGDKSLIVWMCIPTTYIIGSRRPVDILDDPETILRVAKEAWSVQW